jgi:hypothetical protein
MRELNPFKYHDRIGLDFRTGRSKMLEPVERPGWPTLHIMKTIVGDKYLRFVLRNKRKPYEKYRRDRRIKRLRWNILPTLTLTMRRHDD